MQVWKFTFDIDDKFAVLMPRGAKLLHIEVQHGVPCVWTLVDSTAPIAPRHFRLAGTGHEIASRDARHHVGTFLMSGGHLVWHLFDCGEAPEA